MDFKCDELILGKKDADSRALTQHSENPCARLNAWPSSDHYHVQAVDKREFNFEVQFPIKNQAAFRSSSKTTCGCLNPKHLRGLKFSRFS
ncbi:hypothetical protein, partial [Aeromonas caviae]|uniref:hypothetical protein n=1 Tax=Aeromonas caviae TaxID=648 RepID=UPI001C567B54